MYWRQGPKKHVEKPELVLNLNYADYDLLNEGEQATTWGRQVVAPSASELPLWGRKHTVGSGTVSI